MGALVAHGQAALDAPCIRDRSWADHRVHLNERVKKKPRGESRRERSDDADERSRKKRRVRASGMMARGNKRASLSFFLPSAPLLVSPDHSPSHTPLAGFTRVSSPKRYSSVLARS